MYYNIENDISFYDELNKETEEITENICYISRLPLEDTHITLECGHKFNYYYIFHEFYIHKYENFQFFSTKMKEISLKCPYCRTYQTNIIPYYSHLPFGKIYGINDKEENIKEKWFCEYVKKTKAICHCKSVKPDWETGFFYCVSHFSLMKKKQKKEKEKQELKEKKEKEKQELKKEKQELKEKKEKEKQELKEKKEKEKQEKKKEKLK